MASQLHPERALAHPVFWGALALLVCNDHLFKALVPGLVTGKLSDLVGLVVAPVVLATAVRARSRRALAGCFSAVGLVYALLETVAPFARAVEALTAAVGVPWRVWVDPSDLIALPMLAVAWRVLLPVMERPTARAHLEGLGLVLGALGCLATSAIPPGRPATAPGVVVAQAWGGEPLFVLDGTSGERQRVLSFDEAGARALVNGVLYTVHGRSIYGHRLEDGAEVLHHVSEDADYHEVMVADARRLYVIARPGHGHEVERAFAIAHDGTVSWSAALPSEYGYRGPELAPMIASGQLVVAAGAHVVVIDPGSGKRLWSHRAAGEVRTLAAVGPGVFAQLDGAIVALEASSGAPRWKLALEAGESGWHGGRRLAASRDALVTWRDGRLLAIDPVTRGTRWLGPAAEEAAVGDRVAFARLGDGRYGVVDLDGGTLRWSRELDLHILSPPVVMESDGIVVVRPHADELYAFELSDGSLRWRFDLDDGVPVVARIAPAVGAL